MHPFDQYKEINPTEGGELIILLYITDAEKCFDFSLFVSIDLILFPSWLMHMVNPTTGSSERISIAFNIQGEWQDTTNVKTSYTFEAQKHLNHLFR